MNAIAKKPKLKTKSAKDMVMQPKYRQRVERDRTKYTRKGKPELESEQ